MHKNHTAWSCGAVRQLLQPGLHQQQQQQAYCTYMLTHASNSKNTAHAGCTCHAVRHSAADSLGHRHGTQQAYCTYIMNRCRHDGTLQMGMPFLAETLTCLNILAGTTCTSSSTSRPHSRLDSRRIICSQYEEQTANVNTHACALQGSEAAFWGVRAQMVESQHTVQP